MEQERRIDELAVLIRGRFDAARSAKAKHHKDMVDCLNLMHGKALVDSDPDSPDVNADISSPLIKGLAAMIYDIFVGNTARPYTINATPIAELSPAAENEVLNKLRSDPVLQEAMAMGDYDTAEAQAKHLKQVRLLDENRRAANAAEKLSLVIADRLHDADWENQFSAFIQDYCVYSCAFMKAPSVIERTVMRYNGDTVEPVKELVRAVEVVSPFNIYPAPFAEDIQTADYIIERRRLTVNELLTLRNATGYDADTIREVIEDYPKGFTLAYTAGEARATSDTDGYVSETDEEAFDAIGYYGRLRNSMLAEYGITFADDEKLGTSEAEVWVIAGRVIKCLLNPDPMGRRPFYKASFELVSGSFWGISPAMKLRDIQKICTAATRALVKNFNYCSGPIGEVAKGRVKDGLDPTQIIPNTIRQVTEDSFGGGQPAYRFYTVPSQINELNALFAKHHDLAYEVLGLSRLAFGQSQGLGTVGRTSGGVSILMNQSTKSIKYAMSMLEKGLIEPVVQSFVDYEMRTSSDPDILGDIRVYARGVSGLIQKESANQDLEWALQSLAPMVNVIDPQTGRSIVPPSAIQRLLYQIFKNKGIPTDGIFPDFDREEAIGEMMGGAKVRMPAYGEQLDGRSAIAAEAITNANGVLPQ